MMESLTRIGELYNTGSPLRIARRSGGLGVIHSALDQETRFDSSSVRHFVLTPLSNLVCGGE